MEKQVCLSDFLVNKKIKFTSEGVEEIESTVKSLEGKEITWYLMSKERIEKINKNVIDKLKDNATEEEFVFKLIPYISDIKVDIKLKDFKSLVALPPKEFTYILEEIVKIVDDLFTIGEKGKEINEKIEKIQHDRLKEIEALKKEIKKQLEVTEDEEVKKTLESDLKKLERF